MESSKADFSHLFSIVTGTKLNEYRQQYETIEYTAIETELYLGSKIELTEYTEQDKVSRMVVKPTRTRLMV